MFSENLIALGNDIYTKGSGKLKMEYGWVQPKSSLGIVEVYISRERLSELMGVSYNAARDLLDGDLKGRVRTSTGERYGQFFNAEDISNYFIDNKKYWKYIVSEGCYKAWYSKHPKTQYLKYLNIEKRDGMIIGVEEVDKFFGVCHATVLNVLKENNVIYYGGKGSPFILFKKLLGYRVRERLDYFKLNFPKLVEELTPFMNLNRFNDEYIEPERFKNVVNNMMNGKNFSEKTKIAIEKILENTERPFIGNLKYKDELKEILALINNDSVNKQKIIVNKPAAPIQKKAIHIDVDVKKDNETIKVSNASEIINSNKKEVVKPVEKKETPIITPPTVKSLETLREESISILEQNKKKDFKENLVRELKGLRTRIENIEKLLLENL